MSNKVAFHFINPKKYPSKAPFHPPEMYPEYEGTELDPSNRVYEGVRHILFRLGLDVKNFNTPKWNPFGESVKPGMMVFIKANTVVHEHEKKDDIFSVIVHASVLRPILDYVCKALKNEGKIIVGDSQLYSSNFEQAQEASHIESLLSWYSTKTRVSLECFDLRLTKAYRTWLYGRWGREKIEKDPSGYRFVDLADNSAFRDVDPKRLRIAVASYKNMYKHHSNGKHEYLFPQSFLNSDVVIGIPKLKTHRRTAVTLALKNFMGVPALKDSLPHFMVGSPQEGGDQYIYPSIRKRICTRLHDQIQTHPATIVKFACAVTKKIVWNSHKILPFKDDVYEAMWHGNDTLWRTLLDLNRAVLYADKNGKMQREPQRKCFFLIDGITAGEKDGPLAPDPVHAGLLLGSFNPVAIDAVAATLMGFDIQKIPLIKKSFNGTDNAFTICGCSPEDLEIIDANETYRLGDLPSKHNLFFEPHPAWKGHVELVIRA